MSSHLNDRQMAAVLAGEELAPATAAHWADCLACRQRARDLERLLAARRAGLAAGAPDWQEQREAVLARLADRPDLLGARRSGRWWRATLAAAATLVLALGLGLLWPRNGAAPAAELPVADILAEAEALLADDRIPGFDVIDPGLDTLSSVASNGAS